MTSKPKAKPTPVKFAFQKISAPAVAVEERPEFGAGRFSAYGLFKGPEGMWILRVLEIEGDKILSFKDNEPDIRAIQVGKIAMAMEGTEGS